MISVARALALIAAFLCGSASEAQAYDLTETEALTLLREGPFHRELRARVEIARARSLKGTVYPNPSVSTTFEGAGRTDFYMFEQPLALNGRLRLLSQAGESSVAAADSLAEHELRGIEARVRRAFHRLAYAQRMRHGIRDGIVDLRELHRILEEREKAGDGSRFDRLRVEREVMERETELAGAEAEIAEAQASLASYLGAAVDSDGLVATGTLQPAYPLPELADAIADGLSARSDYRVEADRIREHELRAAAAGRQRIPNPVVTGGLKRADVGDRTASGPVLAVSIALPVFDKGRPDRQLAEAEAARARASREILESRIRAEVRSAHAALRIRRRIADDYDAGSGSRAAEIRRIAEIAYREGEIRILDLLDAYRVAQAAELRLLELRADAKLAEVDFDWALARKLIP